MGDVTIHSFCSKNNAGYLPVGLNMAACNSIKVLRLEVCSTRVGVVSVKK